MEFRSARLVLRLQWPSETAVRFVLLDRGATVGEVRVDDLDGAVGTLSWMMDPSERVRGLDREAVEAVVGRLSALGVDAVEATIDAGDRSVEWLRAVGFAEQPGTHGRGFRFSASRPPELYEAQHRLWSAWSEGEGNAAQVASVLADWCGGPGRVLDLGCGAGRELCALAAGGWTGEGLDAGPELIARATQRAERLGVQDRTAFRVGDLLREPVVSGAFDAVLCWDSTLALWLPEVQRRVIGRWVDALRPGGTLVVGQLSQERYAAEGAIAMVLQGEAVGPGTTRRRYVWDDGEQVLVDSVVWESDSGERNRLDDQRLYLQTADALQQMLETLGLRQPRVIGSEGWTWTEQGGPLSTAWQVAAIAHR